MSPAVLILMALLAGGYMAWSIGGNDAANAMGTSVGSRAITLRQAILIGGVFEFAGAALVGSHVTETVRKGIFDIALLAGEPLTLALGMFAALLAAATWLQIATLLRLPVSTTHSIVGAVFGFGFLAVGPDHVSWGTLAFIASSWIVSPLLGGIMGYGTFWVVRRAILTSPDPAWATRRYAPFMIVPVITVGVLSVIYKGLKNLSFDLPLSLSLPLSIGVGLLASGIGTWLMGPAPASVADPDDHAYTERVFRVLQVVTACYMAFAHGANDVANAVGPMAGIVYVARFGSVEPRVGVPLWLLAVGGLGILVGIATWGYKVIETLGTKITDLTPTRGFSAEFSAATVVLVASKLGLPVSTTHTIVGALIGVGFARGISALNLAVVRRILTSWLFEIPVTALMAIGIFLALRTIL